MIENSMCYDITSDEFDIEQELLFEIRRRTPKEKIQSKVIIGNVTIYVLLIKEIKSNDTVYTRVLCRWYIWNIPNVFTYWE